MSKLKKIVLISTIAGLYSGAAFPQGQVAPLQPQKRIITRTRLVSVFSGLENALLEALRNKQQTPLEALLSEGFQMWTPTPPGDPVPREDWQTQAVAESLKAFSIRQMAARSVDENTTLVSFVLDTTVAHAGKSLTTEYFVVDLWQKADDKWRLSDRYASPLAVARKPVTVRPTGKN